MLNKYIIELEVPVALESAECEQILEAQTVHLVEMWRGLLNTYKSKGIRVPTLAVKKISKDEKQTASAEYKLFAKTLLEYHLKYMPKDNVPSQMQVIKQLYALGLTAEQLINLYEESRESYKMTSWHTVKFRLNSKPVAESEGFERKSISDEEKEQIRERLRNLQ
jgi:hypothetical protein